MADEPHLVVLSPGDGLHFASPGDTVSMHYEGSLLSSGAVFDSSFGKAPFSFVQGTHSVISCFEEAAAVMSPGERAELTCPASYAYGEREMTGIPPSSALKFNLQMVSVSPPSFWSTLMKASEQGMPALQQLMGSFGGGLASAGPGAAAGASALPPLQFT